MKTFLLGRLNCKCSAPRLPDPLLTPIHNTDADGRRRSIASNNGHQSLTGARIEIENPREEHEISQEGKVGALDGGVT